MNVPKKSPPHGHFPARQSKQAGPKQPPRPAAVQSKNGPPSSQVKPPAAPPQYRPHPTPKVLQRKAAGNRPPPSAQTARKPSPPPVYRPQPVPKVLQAKKPAAQPPAGRPKSAPVAPPVYRPQPMPKVLQTKKNGVAETMPPHSNAGSLAAQPARAVNTSHQIAQQHKPAGVAPPRRRPAAPVVAGRTGPVAQLKQSPGSIQRKTAAPGNQGIRSKPGRVGAVIQRKYVGTRFNSETDKEFDIDDDGATITAKQKGGADWGELKYAFFKGDAIVEHIHSEPDKGSGIGSLLLNWMALKAAKQGIAVMCVSKPATNQLGFYEAMGFDIKGAQNKVRNLYIQAGREEDIPNPITITQAEAPVSVIISKSGDSVRKRWGIRIPKTGQSTPREREPAIVEPDNDARERYYARLGIVKPPDKEELQFDLEL